MKVQALFKKGGAAKAAPKKAAKSAPKVRHSPMMLYSCIHDMLPGNCGTRRGRRTLVLGDGADAGD
jgi:hypothetical protein